MAERLGYYAGCAARLLGDESYAKRWLGRMRELTEAEFLAASLEIQRRLVAGGFIGPDEDPFHQ